MSCSYWIHHNRRDHNNIIIIIIEMRQFSFLPSEILVFGRREHYRVGHDLF